MTGTGRDRQSRLPVKLGVVVIAMFGFGFALVPIYNVLCDITGLNGKTGSLDASVAQALRVDEGRTVLVEFIANLNQNLDWEFRPEITKMQVHPGKVYTMNYYARNKTRAEMVGQAIPSVTPNTAAAHFNKIECFCFTHQVFEAGEGRSMPVQFVVDTDLPDRIKTVSLSYTFFDVTRTAMK